MALTWRIGLGLLAPLTIMLPAQAEPVQSTDSLGAASTSELQPDPLASLEVPDGLRLDLWAESPDFYNPTAIDVDERGRVWVTEAVNYRKWGGRNPGREHPKGDRVMLLTDTDGDGRCDRSQVFAQDEDLVAPLGIAVIGERVFVSCSPHLLVYSDDDGDGRADRREILLTGFGGFNHDHGLHSVVAGPDGRLYLAVGNAGPHLVTDRDGWQLRSGSLYRGGGPQTADNKPGLVSDDGKQWTGGLVLSMEQDGSGLQVMAHNFRNNYEVGLDSFGNLFQADNDDDGNQSCRTLWCMEAGNHGFFSTDGERTWQADRRPEQDTQTAHWHQDDPGVIPAGCINGAGGPTGCAVYEGKLLEPWIGGWVLNADAGAGVLYGHSVRSVGAGLQLEGSQVIWIKSDNTDDPKRRWFRPSDVAVGPDGSVFVADWFDPGVGGHAAGDREAYGRILRLMPEEPASEDGVRWLANLHALGDLSRVDDQIAALHSPAHNMRELGRAKLAAGGAVAHQALKDAWRRSGPEHLQARLLWLLCGSFGDREVFAEALMDGRSELGVTGLRAMARFHGGHLPVKDLRELGLAKSWTPSLRREVALQLRKLDTASKREALDLFLDLAERVDPTDRYELEAFGLAAEGFEEELYAELAAELGDVALQWDERFAALAWRLHPSAATEALTQRALEAKLSLAQREQALTGLAFTATRVAAEACLLVAQTGQEDLKGLANYWVRHRSTNDWRDFGLERQVSSADMGSAERVFQSPVMIGMGGTGAGHAGAGFIEPSRIELDVTGAETIWLVATDAGDGNSCDWIAWIEPEFVNADGTQSWDLTELSWLSAEAQWGQVRKNANAVGAELRVGQHGSRVIERGLGAHARSVIAYAVPEGATRFQAGIAPEWGGLKQNGGGTTSVRFEVHLQRAANFDALKQLEVRALDGAFALAERQGWARELAAEPWGGLRLLRSKERGELPQELESAVAAAIFKNPDLAVRALASEHFVRPGEATDGEQSEAGLAFPPLSELLAMEGDVVRGRALFTDTSRVQCSTCHVYTLGDTSVGGDIGPDLTSVHSKYAPAELFDSILNPSAAIAFGYDTWRIETKDGELYVGFLLADGESVVLKDTQGLRHVLAAEEIVERTKQRVSTMPDGVALGLSAQELADLVAFLGQGSSQQAVTEQAPVTLLSESTPNLDDWVWHCPDSSVPMEAVWNLEAGVLSCTGQPVGYLRTKALYTNYRLRLEWRFDPAKGAGNSGVLLRQVGVDKVWPKSMEAQLQHRSAGDIWNIDEVPMRCSPSRTNGRHTARAQPSSEKLLGEWNQYDILVDGPRLELRVNGVLQNTADWCEEVAGHICLQSEGAPIEFRNIQLTPL